MKNSKMLPMLIRAAGLIQLILGVMVWAGKIEVLTLIHILIGSILTIALLMLVYQAYRAKVSQGFVILAVVWALLLPVWGLAQDKIFPASFLWIAQILHVLCGLGAIGIAEMLGARMRKMTA